MQGTSGKGWLIWVIQGLGVVYAGPRGGLCGGLGVGYAGPRGGLCRA